MTETVPAAALFVLIGAKPRPWLPDDVTRDRWGSWSPGPTSWRAGTLRRAGRTSGPHAPGVRPARGLRGRRRPLRIGKAGSVGGRRGLSRNPPHPRHLTATTTDPILNGRLECGPWNRTTVIPAPARERTTPMAAGATSWRLPGACSPPMDTSRPQSGRSPPRPTSTRRWSSPTSAASNSCSFRRSAGLRSHRSALAGRPEELGARLAREYVGRWEDMADDDPWPALVRSALLPTRPASSCCAPSLRRSSRSHWPACLATLGRGAGPQRDRAVPAGRDDHGALHLRARPCALASRPTCSRPRSPAPLQHAITGPVTSPAPRPGGGMNSVSWPRRRAGGRSAFWAVDLRLPGAAGVLDRAQPAVRALRASRQLLVTDDHADLRRLRGSGWSAACSWPATCSDVHGRRPHLLGGRRVGDSSGAAVFIALPTLSGLFAARIISGISVGLTVSTATAYLERAAPAGTARAPMGLAPSSPRRRRTSADSAWGLCWPGVLAQYAGDPLVLPYVTMLAMLALAGVAVALSPETRIAPPTGSRLARPAAVGARPRPPALLRRPDRGVVGLRRPGGVHRSRRHVSGHRRPRHVPGHGRAGGRGGLRCRHRPVMAAPGPGRPGGC